jgi:hypothetical protein
MTNTKLVDADEFYNFICGNFFTWTFNALKNNKTES